MANDDANAIRAMVSNILGDGGQVNRVRRNDWAGATLAQISVHWSVANRNANYTEAKEASQMNTMLVILFCVALGSVAAIFWPRRNSPEARVFLLTAMLTAAAVALVNSWKRSGKR
ncbi:MAG TPA: hypothetical protein VMU48_19935 [Terracidiphilus sp.]|nr:hypothetical protein [Terracidiphilus sp.]